MEVVMNSVTKQTSEAGLRSWIVSAEKVSSFLGQLKTTDYGASFKEIMQATGFEHHRLSRVLGWMINRNKIERGEHNYDMYFLVNPSETVAVRPAPAKVINNLSAGGNTELINAATNMMNASAQLMSALAKVI
jgi:hypothetical protein